MYGSVYGNFNREVDVDEFRAAQDERQSPGTQGWWVTVMDGISVEQQKSLAAAAADRTISHQTISTVLRRWGHKVSAGQVGHWRRTHVG